MTQGSHASVPSRDNDTTRNGGFWSEVVRRRAGSAPAPPTSMGSWSEVVQRQTSTCLRILPRNGGGFTSTVSDRGTVVPGCMGGDTTPMARFGIPLRIGTTTRRRCREIVAKAIRRSGSLTVAVDFVHQDSRGQHQPNIRFGVILHTCQVTQEPRSVVSELSRNYARKRRCMLELLLLYQADSTVVCASAGQSLYTIGRTVTELGNDGAVLQEENFVRLIIYPRGPSDGRIKAQARIRDAASSAVGSAARLGWPWSASYERAMWRVASDAMTYNWYRRLSLRPEYEWKPLQPLLCTVPEHRCVTSPPLERIREDMVIMHTTPPPEAEPEDELHRRLQALRRDTGVREVAHQVFIGMDPEPDYSPVPSEVNDEDVSVHPDPVRASVNDILQGLATTVVERLVARQTVQPSPRRPHLGITTASSASSDRTPLISPRSTVAENITTFRRGGMIQVVHRPAHTWGGAVLVTHARPSLQTNMGVDTAIRRVGGPTLLSAIARVPRIGGSPFRVAPGHHVLTIGGDLNVNHVAHAVSPNGTEPEAEDMYRRLIEGIVIRLISRDTYSLGFPSHTVRPFGPQRTAELALSSMSRVMERQYTRMTVEILCGSEIDYAIWNTALSQIRRSHSRGTTGTSNAAQPPPPPPPPRQLTPITEDVVVGDVGPRTPTPPPAIPSSPSPLQGGGAWPQPAPSSPIRVIGRGGERQNERRRAADNRDNCAGHNDGKHGQPSNTHPVISLTGADTKVPFSETAEDPTAADADEAWANYLVSIGIETLPDGSWPELVDVIVTDEFHEDHPGDAAWGWADTAGSREFYEELLGPPYGQLGTCRNSRGELRHCIRPGHQLDWVVRFGNGWARLGRDGSDRWYTEHAVVRKRTTSFRTHVRGYSSEERLILYPILVSLKRRFPSISGMISEDLAEQSLDAIVAMARRENEPFGSLETQAQQGQVLVDTAHYFIDETIAALRSGHERGFQKYKPLQISQDILPFYPRRVCYQGGASIEVRGMSGSGEPFKLSRRFRVLTGGKWSRGLVLNPRIHNPHDTRVIAETLVNPRRVVQRIMGWPEELPLFRTFGWQSRDRIATVYCQFVADHGGEFWLPRYGSLSRLYSLGRLVGTYDEEGLVMDNHARCHTALQCVWPSYRESALRLNWGRDELSSTNASEAIFPGLRLIGLPSGACVDNLRDVAPEYWSWACVVRDFFETWNKPGYLEQLVQWGRYVVTGSFGRVRISALSVRHWHYRHAFSLRINTDDHKAINKVISEIAHEKRQLRRRLVKGMWSVPDFGNVLTPFVVETKWEFRKEGKDERAFEAAKGTTLEDSSMCGSDIPEYAKKSMNGVHTYVLTVGWIEITIEMWIVLSPTPEILEMVLARLAEGYTIPGLVVCFVFGDDGSISGNVLGRDFGLNCDLSKCDRTIGHHTMTLIHEFASKYGVDIADAIVAQTRAPCKVPNTANPQEFFHVKPVKCMMYSGVGTTTTAGTFHNIIGMLFFIRNLASAMLIDGFATTEQVHELMKRSYLMAGSIVTIDDCADEDGHIVPERFMALKHFRSSRTGALMTTPGAYFRSAGWYLGTPTHLTFGWTPNQFNMSNDDDKFTRLMAMRVAGLKHEPSHSIIDTLRARFGKDPAPPSRWGNGPSSSLDYSSMPERPERENNDDALALHLDCTEGEISAFCKKVWMAHCGMRIEDQLLNKMYAVAYNLKPADDTPRMDAATRFATMFPTFDEEHGVLLEEDA